MAGRVNGFRDRALSGTNRCLAVSVSSAAMETALNPYLIECVERACRRESLAISLKLKRGIGSLATISATAIFIGLFGTVLGMFNGFQTIGTSRTTALAMTTEAIAQSLVPTLLGFFVAITAFVFYRYLCGRMEAFELEMKGASIDLANRLVVHVRRAGHTDFLYFAPSTKRKRVFGGNLENLPRFTTDRIYRNGVLELIWPRLQSDLDADSTVRSGAVVLFAYALMGWIVCFWQHRPVAGLVIAAYFAFSGWMVKRGSRAAIYGAFVFFAFTAVANFVPYGWDISLLFLVFAPALLLGSLKGIHLRRLRGGSPAVSAILGVTVAALGISSAIAVLFGTVLMLYPMGTDTSMEPNLHPGDWVVSLNAPVMGEIHRGDLVSFSYLGSVGTERVAGVPGDRIEVKSGRLIRNSQIVDEPYVQRPYRRELGDFPLTSEVYPDGFIRWQHETAFRGKLRADTSFVVPAGSYFLLNDDRNEILDSRIFGAVRVGNILGKPIFISRSLGGLYIGQTRDRR